MKFILVSLALAIAASPQDRILVPEEVVTARPQPGQGSGSPRPKYVPVGPASANGQRQIGVTIWRLGQAAPGDSGARILVQEENQRVEWVPERVAATSALRGGDRVRLSIESPESGYLYVIDRERYASGERGQPFLIFPTTRTRGGDNKVSAGKLIEIPAQDDQPNFFSLRKSRLDQVEEELLVLLAPQPIADLSIGPRALALTNDQAAQWEKQWGAGKTDLFELSGGVGKTWSRAEQQAGADGTRLLTQEDPPPQTVYRVAAGPGQPFLVRVRLRYQTDTRR